MEGKVDSYNRETSTVNIKGIEVQYDESRVNMFLNEVEIERARLTGEYQQKDPPEGLDPNVSMVLDSVIDVLNIIKDRISWLP